VAPSIRRKLVITSPTSGGRSVGIVLSREQTMEFSFFFVFFVFLVFELFWKIIGFLSEFYETAVSPSNLRWMLLGSRLIRYRKGDELSNQKDTVL
jgi:hypothetical protein